MANYWNSFFLLSSWSIILCRQSALAFMPTTASSTSPNAQIRSGVLPRFPNSSSLVLHAGFEQLPGENTTDFIKRVTSQSNELLEKQKNGGSKDDSNNDDESPKIRGKYQRIEDWDAERTAKGELTWEEKVQFDGQRYGNQIKQNSILQRHLGSF